MLYKKEGATPPFFYQGMEHFITSFVLFSVTGHSTDVRFTVSIYISLSIDLSINTF
jgi:hypothetical protein